MLNDWALLSDELQATLATQAMREAIESVASQAETLAREMETGSIADRGGPDALRLLAALVRVASQATVPEAGNA